MRPARQSDSSSYRSALELCERYGAEAVRWKRLYHQQRTVNVLLVVAAMMAAVWVLVR